jgi:tetraacyldisaccharide 4'-kinase
MTIRNWAFDQGIIRSRKFDIPIIAVGNLNVGGTGKSPQIEYLIRLLMPAFEIAVLSRGYGRTTKGFLLSDENSTAEQLGDEPLQFYRKFKNLCVAVDEKREHGIEQIQRLKPKVELVLLDDAFQHRHVEAGLYVLLTAWDDLYADDLLLPAGNLREPKSGAQRAHIIVVTKCPPHLSAEEQAVIINKLNPGSHQKVFFNTIVYQDQILGNQKEVFMNDLNEYGVLLVTGIANPKPLMEFLTHHKVSFKHMKFADHQNLGKAALKTISQRYDAIAGDKKIILTTEKDYVRNFLNVDLPVYYLPIRTEFIENGDGFNNLINDYVRKN